MTDNPQAPQQRDPGPGIALPDYRILAMTGPGAAAFAQAQFMNDVAALAPGTWQWNGWLTPKGRVLAVFALLRITDDTFWLLLPDADPAELAGQLQRYVFRSKLSLSPRDALPVIGTFAAPGRAAGARLAIAGEEVELDWSGDGAARTLRIGGADASPSAPDPAAAGRWRALDLVHGLPRLGAAQAGEWTPQMLSLDRLRAFSVKKGCYPGQEIVARTHFLGQAKRGLALYAGAVDLEPGQALEAEDGSAASVVSTATGDEGPIALAVTAADPPGTLRAGEHLLRHRPMAGGFAR